MLAIIAEFRYPIRWLSWIEHIEQPGRIEIGFPRIIHDPIIIRLYAYDEVRLIFRQFRIALVLCS